MLKKGDIVRLSEVAKIQQNIETQYDILGIIIESVNMGKLMGWENNYPGYKVMTFYGTDFYSQADIEVLNEEKGSSC